MDYVRFSVPVASDHWHLLLDGHPIPWASRQDCHFNYHPFLPTPAYHPTILPPLPTHCWVAHFLLCLPVSISLVLQVASELASEQRRVAEEDVANQFRQQVCSQRLAACHLGPGFASHGEYPLRRQH